MERDFAAYLFTLFCPLFTSGASFSIAHEYSVRNLLELGGGAKLSQTEMNVLQTMIAVVVCYMLCWSPGAFALVVQLNIPVCSVPFD